ncbi:S1/P1 nuclease [Roseateles sp.]|uniref:S1/P1 nuclease n=1 Tax=Roseateles sp. TaxID=1971397 RepID=UPI0025F09820|nr:S1/P1 nuclease [Roseateles sp.]MBV8034687.1 S1/P1 nuclease [Roseateles sp.]
MLSRLLTAALFAPLIATTPNAHAWGANGHQAVATLAADLIRGTPAEAQVKALLGDMTLQEAAIWPDCAKGISAAQGYSYPNPGKYASCASLETPARIAEMANYVRRNDRQCEPKPGEESCHQQYHYTDVAFQRSRYIQGFAGTSEHDIVGAMRAAIAVLQGRPATPPMDFASPREALIVLTHLVGDMHEPLHVGAVYLDADGHAVDPDKVATGDAEFTVGGNRLLLPVVPPARPLSLHTMWDDIPEALDSQHVGTAWLKAARHVHATPGPLQDWPARWANESLEQARDAFNGLSFSTRRGEGRGTHWNMTLPAGYDARMASMKRHELTLAGARLAQLLNALWPQPPK